MVLIPRSTAQAASTNAAADADDTAAVSAAAGDNDIAATITAAAAAAVVGYAAATVAGPICAGNRKASSVVNKLRLATFAVELAAASAAPTSAGIATSALSLTSVS